MNILYALSDPRQPNLIKYVGRTTIGTNGRLRTHISQAKYRARHDKALSKSMHWILDLLDNKLEPQITKLASYDDVGKAIAAEMMLIEQFAGTILNDPNTGLCLCGKPAGTKDTALGRANKTKSWADTLDYRKKKLAEAAPRQKGSRRPGFVERRKALGFPHPEFGRRHPLNTKHYDELLKSGVVRVRSSELRRQEGFPYPDFDRSHQLNRQYYRNWLKQKRMAT